MTEYSVEKFYSEYALKKEDSIIAVIDSGTNARKVCDLLNEQDERIKELEKENRGLQFKIIDMLDFVKEKGTVTREEIKKWWNGDVE